MLATTIATMHPPTATSAKIRRYVVSAFADAVFIWLALYLLSLYSLSRLQPGTAYIFVPRGVGLLEDALAHILLITGFFLLYTFPSFAVRPWLGWTLRIFMFGLFVVFLTFMLFIKIIAIVETPDHRFIFYPHYPLAPRVYATPPNASWRQTAVVTSINFLTGTVDDLVTYPVLRNDTAGQADLQRLRQHINIVNTASD